MVKIYLKILFLLIFFNQHLAGQKVDTSYFIIYDSSINKSDTSKLDTSISMGYTNTFCVYREYFSKSTFKEINLFGSNFFYIKNNVWYVKKGNRWVIFFSNEGFKTHALFFKNYNFKLVPWEMYIEKGEQLFKYYLSKKNGLIRDINPNEYVVFSPVRGFIKIVNNSIILIRVNKKPKVYVECK